MHRLTVLLLALDRRPCALCRDKDCAHNEGQSSSSLPSLNSTAMQLYKEGGAPVLSFAQLISPPGTSRSSMDVDNPFTDVTPTKEFTRSRFSDHDDGSAQSLSTCVNYDERSGQAAGSATSQPWRIPAVLVRKQSQALGNAECSPLRHSFSCRNETAGLSDSLLPARRRLSISSVSLEALNTKPCTPRQGSECHAVSASAGCTSRIAGASSGIASGSGSNSNSDSPLSASSLKHLSSNQAARIMKSDAGAVDPYVN